MTEKNRPVQKELRCPACSRELTWSCYGDEGHAYCEMLSTQMSPSFGRPLCAYRGIVRRHKDGTVHLVQPPKIPTLLKRVFRRLKTHKESVDAFQWIAYERQIVLYEKTPYGQFQTAVMQVQRDNKERDELEITWERLNKEPEKYTIARDADKIAKKLDELFVLQLLR